MTAEPRAESRSHQGIALLVVLVLVLLSAMLALWGFRSAGLHEAVVGNDADYQRAFEAAQALLQDAEFDIRGERPDGTPCQPDAALPDLCRAAAAVWFIDEIRDLGTLIQTLSQHSSGCHQGICVKRAGAQDFWNAPETLSDMLSAGARYGQFTGARSSNASHPLLAERSAGRGGWYWVEVLPYADGSTTVVSHQKIDLRLDPNLIYRITALARGLRPGTQVVLQSVYVPLKQKD